MKKCLLLSISILAHVCAAPPTTVGGTGPLYTIGFQNGNVYAVDLQNRTFTILEEIVGSPNFASVVLIDRNTAYIGGQDSHTIYKTNLQNGTFMTTETFPASFAPAGIALLDGTTAFVTGFAPDIYTFNQRTNQISLFAQIPGASLYDIQILNDSTAYITDTSNKLYSLDLKTGASHLVATFPMSVGLADLQLVNNTAAYVSGGSDAKIYAVDLTTGAITLVTPSSVGSAMFNDALFGVALDQNTLYTPNFIDNTLFAVDVNTGLHSSILTVPGAEFTWATLYLQMLTNGLSGNNLRLANYLNTNAPLYVIRSFALQANGLPAALEAASPLRNAFTTYATQNAYLASSQLLIDHSRRIRFNHKMAAQNLAAALTTDASNIVQQSTAQKSRKKKKYLNIQPTGQMCKQKEHHNIWFTPFGEYAHEKAQMQAPAFTMSVGGGLLGYDYTAENGNAIGLGGSYVYTHVHHAHGMGHANINQGFGTAYTTLTAGEWYTDISIWGGYYSSSNTRNIEFPGVDVKAQATINGWQTAAHLETGYNHFTLPDCETWFGIEPFAMGDWVGNWEHSFHERGAGNFNMGQRSRFASFLRAEGGLRFHEMIKFEGGSYLVFREKASYAYQKAFKTGHITAFLIGSPGTFTVSTLTGAQNLGVFEFSLLYHCMRGAYFDVRYQGEYGSMYWSHQGMFEIGYDF